MRKVVLHIPTPLVLSVDLISLVVTLTHVALQKYASGGLEVNLAGI